MPPISFKDTSFMGAAIMGMQQAKAELIGVTTGKTATYVGSGTAIIGGLTVNEWAMVIGAICAIAGLVLGQYWQIRRNKREKEIARATIAALERGASISVITDDYGNTTNASIQ